ncbi:MAG: glycoside-pentoside-hexuronide (GPH):cation symporter [Lachnospiraceae bacterium]|nr:glycoside-pentoside-hexuronide (GPH):cation symporter [Lachnospiraceae bacterium]
MKEKQEKRNLFCYPLGTVGRDFVYNLFTNYILLFILFTKRLTAGQLAVITGIMVAARIFDALNDPVMGNIIERTRGKFGKFKPWLLAGVISTSVVIYLAFNVKLDGWNFVIFFGIIYFAYSITYTMHDISYWGMVPALSKNGDTRNRLTSMASFCAGVGGTLASILIPLLTTGDMALGGNAQTAYGYIALIAAVISILFILFPVIGAKENRSDMDTPAPKVSFKKIISTIGGNDQLLWISLIFLIQEVGNGIVLGGAGANYIYFEFGYEGGLYSTFSTVGMLATAVLMIIYPSLSKKYHRMALAKFITCVAVGGYAVQLLAGIFMPATMIKFWVITVGFMFSNLGQYGLYLIMMISIINTVEYNELKKGTRDEAIITSMRPFLTKMASSITVIIVNLTFILSKVISYTNQISDYEAQANQGVITAEAKGALIKTVTDSVSAGQKNGLLIAMTVIPCALMVTSVVLYRKFYKLDEETYEDILKQLDDKKAQEK